MSDDTYELHEQPATATCDRGGCHVLGDPPRCEDGVAESPPLRPGRTLPPQVALLLPALVIALCAALMWVFGKISD
jgi:hypothetical protein